MGGLEKRKIKEVKLPGLADGLVTWRHTGAV